MRTFVFLLFLQIIEESFSSHQSTKCKVSRTFHRIVWFSKKIFIIFLAKKFAILTVSTYRVYKTNLSEIKNRQSLWLRHLPGRKFHLEINFENILVKKNSPALGRGRRAGFHYRNPLFELYTHSSDNSDYIILYGLQKIL